MPGSAVAVLLAAGRGTRLSSMAAPFSKPLLPVNGRPVVAYAAQAAVPFVDEIIVVAHPTTLAQVMAAVLEGIRSDPRPLIAAVQSEPRGVADAIDVGLAELTDDRPLVVLCGDNIVESQDVGTALNCVQRDDGGHSPIQLAWTYKEFEPRIARRFAVWSPGPSGRGMLVEKPAHPPSRVCWCGPLAFRSSNDVRRRIARLSPSARGEVEVTDLLNSFLLPGQARGFPLQGVWFDIGTPDSLREARRFMQRL